MTDEIQVQIDNDLSSIKAFNDKVNTKITDNLQQAIHEINNPSNSFDELKFNTMRNKLFLKFLGIDYEGLFQSLHKNTKLK
jgi:hypothetical protein